MKKLIIVLACILVGLTANAQVACYQTTFFSMAEWNEKTELFDWSDWVYSDNIPIEITEKTVRVYTEEIQNYIIHDQIRDGDDDAGYFMDYNATDQDGLKCIVKFRVQKKDNVMQICIYYFDNAWAYCIERV